MYDSYDPNFEHHPNDQIAQESLWKINMKMTLVLVFIVGIAVLLYLHDQKNDKHFDKLTLTAEDIKAKIKI